MGAVTGWLIVPGWEVPDWLVLWAVMGVPFTGLAGEVVPGVSGVLVCGLNQRVEVVRQWCRALLKCSVMGNPQVDRAVAYRSTCGLHHRLGEGVKAQLQVGENIVNVLDTDCQANEVRVHANLLQFLSGKLSVGGGGGVNHERAHVTDVRHVGV